MNGPTPQPQSASGLNVIGYLRDETGVGEAARAVLRALHAQGFPVAGTTAPGYTARQQDHSVSHVPTGHPYATNLLHVNADQVPIVYEALGPALFVGKYNIGFWFWETASFPQQWYDRFDYFDELWVGSKFVQDTLAQVAPIPVVNIGLPLERETEAPIIPTAPDLPTDKFIFLFTFDMLSVFERKNPLGLIEAYRRAFGPDFQDTLLVLKVTKLDEFPRHRKQLGQALASVSGLLVDRYLERAELDGLFHRCDAYVSLHRSEGFGLTMAEAMYLGKPTIATAYSGNMDFMHIGNSYPVEYRLIELEQDYGPYQKGTVWADPDLDHAAAQMRRVFENRDEARRKGDRAAADLRSLYSSQVVAQRIIARLAILKRTGQERSADARRWSGAPPLRPASQALPPPVNGPALERLRETARVNPHLPIAWPTWPKGIWPKIAALTQKVVRRLLRWYINPIVEQQNRFNTTVVQALDELHREVSHLQAQARREAPANVPEANKREEYHLERQ